MADDLRTRNRAAKSLRLRPPGKTRLRLLSIVISVPAVHPKFNDLRVQSRTCKSKGTMSGQLPDLPALSGREALLPASSLAS